CGHAPCADALRGGAVEVLGAAGRDHVARIDGDTCRQHRRRPGDAGRAAEPVADRRSGPDPDRCVGRHIRTRRRAAAVAAPFSSQGATEEWRSGSAASATRPDRRPAYRVASAGPSSTVALTLAISTLSEAT